MSFLDRFQNKIATVTAYGHLKKADGSEEIRVGPPKRRPKPEPAAAKQQRANIDSNERAIGHSIKQATGGKQTGGGGSAYDNNHVHRDNHNLPHHHEDDGIPGRLEDDDWRYDEPQTTSRSYGASKSPAHSPANERQQQQHQQQRQQHRSGNAPSPELRSRSPRATTTAHNTSPPKELRSPLEINEARVQSDADQLAFSRKARPVQYEPCKLSQYKKEKPGEYYELGKLQPDLNSDELVQKRANAERVKAFSKNLRAINKTAQPPKKSDANSDAQPVTATAKNTSSTRSKALEFAKRIPKPKPSSRSSPEDDALSSSAPSSNIQAIAPSSRPINSVLDDDSEDDEVSSELQQLQLRHQLSRAQVDVLIKKT